MSGHRPWSEIRTQRGIPRGDFRAQQRPFPGFEEFDAKMDRDTAFVKVAAIVLLILGSAVVFSIVAVVLYLLLKNFG